MHNLVYLLFYTHAYVSVGQTDRFGRTGFKRGGIRHFDNLSQLLKVLPTETPSKGSCFLSHVKESAIKFLILTF